MFWGKYFKPGHRLALARIRGMDPTTRAQVWGVWLGTFLITEAIVYLVKLSSPDERTGQLLGLAWAALLSQTLSFYIYMVVPFRTWAKETNRVSLPTRSIWKQHGVDLVSESLYVAAYAVLWSMLGIIPGIFKALRWAYVPYIVMTDERYFRGELHARTESNRLVTGITWAIFIIWCAYTAIELGFSWSEGLSEDWNLPYIGFTWRLVLSLASLYVLLYSVLLDFGIYQLRLNEREVKQ
jgi:hypothetical protein